MASSFGREEAGRFPYLRETHQAKFARDQGRGGNRKTASRAQLLRWTVFTKKKSAKPALIIFWLLPCGNNVAEYSL
jgi:hypothetical protein